MSTIGQNDRRIQYTTAGGESSFAYDFQIDDADHIRVDREGTTLVRGTDYTVTGVGDSGGGTIVPDGSITIASGETWTLLGETPEDRSNDYSGFVQVKPATVDADLDRMIFMLQQARRDVDRSLRVSVDDNTGADDLIIPGSVARGGKLLGFADDGSLAVLQSIPESSTPGALDETVSDNDMLRWDAGTGEFKKVVLGTHSIPGRTTGDVDAISVATNELVGRQGGALGTIAVAASRLFGRKASGDMGPLTASEVRTLLSVLTQSQVEAYVDEYHPETATDGGTDAYDSETTTATPDDGDIIVREFDSANTTVSPTLDGNSIVDAFGNGWAGMIRAKSHRLQWDNGNTRYILLDPNGLPASEGVVDATNGGSNDLTEIDFTGLASGAKRITILLFNVSLDANDDFLFQIGDSGGVETSGYSSSSISITTGGSIASSVSTSGFALRAGSAGNAMEAATVTLVLVDPSSNAWEYSTLAHRSDDTTYHGSGEKSLSAELDRVRITGDGTAKFDNGSINVRVET